MNKLPKAAQEILSLPGVQSLEREPDGWCCHLRYGWTTDALGGGSTIIDTNLRTIRSYVRGAYVMAEAAEPEPAPVAAPAPAPRLADRALIVCEALLAAQTLRPILPGETLPPAPPAWDGPGPELPELPSRFRPWPPAGLLPWENVTA
jgi:hypothetical protein